MKKTILMVAMAGMMVVGNVVNAGLMTYRGYMPDDPYTARNDVSLSDIAQIEWFLGMGADQHMTLYDKWEPPTSAYSSGDYGFIEAKGTTKIGEWQTIPDATGASIMTVKADGMIGIWSTNVGTDPNWDFNFENVALSGDWDTDFTKELEKKDGSLQYPDGAAVSHITWWNGYGDGGDRDPDPPTVAEPATMGLLFLGMAGIASMVGKRRKKV